MDWLHAIPEHLIHRVIATCILLYAPIMIFRRTYIPRKRMAAINLRITAESIRLGCTARYLVDDERRRSNRFWLLVFIAPISVFALVCLGILWQDALFGR